METIPTVQEVSTCLSGDVDSIHGVEFIDQNPIGKSSRSNPVTYLKAWDDIRKIFADEKLSKLNGFKPAHFSFNVPEVAVKNVRGKESSRSRCNLWQMSTWNVNIVKENVSMWKFWK